MIRPLAPAALRCADDCPGFLHMNEPFEIERCDECGRFDTDDEARHVHRIECGCDHPDEARRSPCCRVPLDEDSTECWECGDPLTPAIFRWRGGARRGQVITRFDGHATAIRAAMLLMKVRGRLDWTVYPAFGGVR